MAPSVKANRRVPTTCGKCGRRFLRWRGDWMRSLPVAKHRCPTCRPPLATTTRRNA